MRNLRPLLFATSITALLCAGLAPAARADDTETRMRDALRQAVSQMRAAQDEAAQAQAQVAQLTADKAALQAQLDAAKAQLGKSAKADDLKALQAQLEESRAQAGALSANINKWQSAYQQAQGFAQTKDRETQQAKVIATANTNALQTCKAANTKLVALATEVLHLYESQSFRSVLLKSYEPLLGTAKVDLENLVQDYDAKIQDQEYRDTGAVGAVFSAPAAPK